MLVLGLVVFVADAGGAPGARIAALVVFGASFVPAVAAMVHHWWWCTRSFPDRRVGSVPPGLRRLRPVLLAGEPVAEADRDEARRMVWWQLSRSVGLAWTTPALIAIISANTADRAGRTTWNGWSTVLVVAVLAAISLLAWTTHTNARWRDIAGDPALVDVAPSA